MSAQGLTGLTRDNKGWPNSMESLCAGTMGSRLNLHLDTLEGWGSALC